MFLKINFDPIPKHTLFSPFPPSHTPAYHDTVLFEELETVDFFKNTKNERKNGEIMRSEQRYRTGGLPYFHWSAIQLRRAGEGGKKLG